MLQVGTIELFGYTCVLSFQKREEGPQRQFRDDQGCHSHHKAQRAQARSLRGKGRERLSPPLCQRRGLWPSAETHSVGCPPIPRRATLRTGPYPEPLHRCGDDGAGGQSIESKRIILEASDLMEFALLGLGLAWDPSPLPFFLLLSFGGKIPVLCLSHHCSLKSHVFCGFTGSRLERNFASG